MKQRKFRVPNRWEAASALLVIASILVAVWLRVMKTCGERDGSFGHYCGLNETFIWLRAGGNWELWAYLSLLVLVLLAACFAGDEK